MGDLNVGSLAIDRASTNPYGNTTIDLANPATAAFIVDTIEVFPNIYNNLTGFRVGSFYLVNGTTYKCRASANIGAVVADGKKKTFPGLSISFENGDFIGSYWTAGRIERANSGGSGFMVYGGECIDAGDSAVFSGVGWAGMALSVYGKCTIVLGHPYILRVQGIPGMRSFSQLGHGGM